MGGFRFTEAIVRVLGPVAVEGPSGDSVVRGRQPAAVAAFLAVNNRPASRDELAELLWGDQLSPHWQSALRGVVSKVRSSFVQAGFAPTVVRSDDTVVQLGIPGLRTDLELIEQLAELDDPPEGELVAAKAALARPFLPHDDSNWGRYVRDRIRSATQRVNHRHVQLLREAGRLEQAVAELRSAVVLDPFDEPTHHLLIETLVGAGRRTEASDVLDTLTTRLDFELGITPAPATTELLRVPAETLRIPSRSTTPAVHVRTTLHPHADEPFVGRRRELGTLRRVWAEVVEAGRPQLVIIEGPAGIGKTRLVDHFYDDQRGEVGHLMWGRNRDAGDRAFGALAGAVQRLVENEPELIDRLGDRARGLWPLLPGFTSASSDRDDASIREELVDALRVLLLELSSEPSFWFVDDLQWASPDEVSVIEAVVDGLQVPVMVLATTRTVPPEIAGGLGSLQRVLPTTPMKLDALTVEEIGEMLIDGATPARSGIERGGCRSSSARSLGRPASPTTRSMSARSPTPLPTGCRAECSPCRRGTPSSCDWPA